MDLAGWLVADRFNGFWVSKKSVGVLETFSCSMFFTDRSHFCKFTKFEIYDSFKFMEILKSQFMYPSAILQVFLYSMQFFYLIFRSVHRPLLDRAGMAADHPY